MTEKKPDDGLVWAGFWLVGIPALIAGGPIAGLIGAAAGTVLGGMLTPDPEKSKSYRMGGTFSGQIKEEYRRRAWRLLTTVPGKRPAWPGTPLIPVSFTPFTASLNP